MVYVRTYNMTFLPLLVQTLSKCIDEDERDVLLEAVVILPMYFLKGGLPWFCILILVLVILMKGRRVIPDVRLH